MRDGSKNRHVVLSLNGDAEQGPSARGSAGGAQSEPGTRKRPLERCSERSNERCGSGKAPPPLPPRRDIRRMEGSWLALRKELHDRYRYFEEHRAAEEAAAEAGRGSGSRGTGLGEEVLCAGLRYANPRKRHDLSGVKAS